MAFVRRHRLFFTFGLFALLPVLAFPELIFGQQTLYWSDLSWIHYPRHIFSAAEWLAGRVPLWDPYQHTGLPFLAESQVGALYPLSAIFLAALSPSLELSIYILLHFSLAATFTLMLARRLGLAWMPATVAGLSFGMAGFLMAQVPNLNIMTGAVWLPLILYGVIQVDRRRSWLAALLAGSPIALQIFTAQPQIVFYSLLSAAGYTLFRITADFFGPTAPARHSRKYALHTAALMLAAVGSGLLLAAPQWLATLELQQLSVRSVEKSLGFLTNNSLPPEMLFNLLMPGIFGNNAVGFSGGDPFHEDFIYIGFLPLLMVCFSLGQRRRRDALFFYLLLAGGLLLALGRYTPLYALVIQHLPGFALFRIPARWLMVINLSLAILAGFGLQTMLDKGLSRAQFVAVAVAGGVLVGLMGLARFFGAPPAVGSDWWAAFLKHGFTPRPDGRLLLATLPWLTAPAFLLLANIAGATVLLAAYSFQKISRDAFGLLLVVLVSLDLVAAGGTTINPTQPESWWHQLSGGAEYVRQHVGDARVFPLGMGTERAATSHLGHYFPSVYHLRSAGGHGSSLMLSQLDGFLHEAHPVQAIQVLGVKYLLTEGQLGADAAATYPLAFSDDTSFVYENPHPLPRAFVVHQLVQAQTPAGALNHLRGTDINPATTVIIEADTPLPQPQQSPVAGAATIVAEHPQRVEIAVDAPASGYLVLLDTFYPGWQATVAGQPTPIYRANAVGRAVFVPAGQHTVVFEYRPFWFGVGLWLAAGGVTTIGVAAGLSRRKQKRRTG